MTCAIMQPTYLPWLGYFDLIDQVNHFIFLDSVQLTKRSWQVRNRIYTQQGELFLTVPLQKTTSRFETQICNAVIDNEQRWKEKHLSSIEHAYGKSPFFQKVYPFIWEIYNQPYIHIADFNINMVQRICNRIGIHTRFYRASEMGFDTGLRKDDLLSGICKKLDCSNYLSPIGSSAYIEMKTPGGALNSNNIALYYQHYEHPAYTQLKKPFLPYMCILDLLFNEGFEKSAQVIKQGRKHPYYFEQYNRMVSSKAS